MPGAYILIIDLKSATELRIGSLGNRAFAAGVYAYIGSALRGFQTRLPHHLRRSERPRWHIDYLLRSAALRSILVIESRLRQECAVAGLLRTRFKLIPDFGSSDCRCAGHLVYLGQPAAPEAVLTQLLREAGFPAELFKGYGEKPDRPDRPEPG